MRGSSDGLLPSRSQRSAWILCLVLLLGCLLAYHRVGSHGYVDYDDDTYVTANPYVLAGLNGESFQWAFTSASYGANWHPLTWISHMLDVQLFGADNPGAAHWENVLLHALVAGLFFWGLLTSTRRMGAAFFAAALFAWHPLRVESVAWISERKDLLSAVFLCLCIWSYVRWTRRGGLLSYGFVMLSLALGLMAKPMLVSTPVLLIVLDAFPLGRLRNMSAAWPRLREKLPLFGLSLITALLTFSAQSSDGVVAQSIPLGVGIANAFASIGIYLWQTLWPFKLCCMYPLASSISARPMDLLWLAASVGLATLVALSWLSWKLRQSFPALGAGWLWYLISVAPVIGLIQVGEQAHADRYTYIPLLGLAAALALGIDRLLQNRRTLRTPCLALSLLLLAGLLWLTERQTTTWSDSKSLFQQALRVERKSPIMLGNAGYLEQRAGAHEKAVQLFEEALQVGVPRFSIQLNLAHSLIQLSRLKQARELLSDLLTNYPEDWLVHSNLGELAFRSQDLAQARQHYQQAIALGSSNEQDRLQLGLLWMDEAPKVAREHLLQAIADNPQSAQAHFALATLELKQGNPDLALPLLERAVQLSDAPPPQLLESLKSTRALVGP